ncbi:MAG: response regulator [Deltaproteobacteria bacterium]|nr:response regulator [Deltaproteobacteria bacterium]
MARILIIDDEEPVRSMLRQMLEGAGYEVEEASDGDEGIRLFRSKPADLVVTDLLMPNKGGLVTISELRREHPAVRVIAISGGGRNGKLNFLSTARTFAGVRTLRKPFRRAELLEMVADVLASDPTRPWTP